MIGIVIDYMPLNDPNHLFIDSFGKFAKLHVSVVVLWIINHHALIWRNILFLVSILFTISSSLGVSVFGMYNSQAYIIEE